MVSFPWNVHPLVARCFRYRYGRGFNDRPFTICLLRFHEILVIYPKWGVPFVKNAYFLEKTRSVISNSFISFFKQTLLPWYVPYIFMTSLLISHFFYFCNTCLFLKFRNSSDVARRNIMYYVAKWFQIPLATLALVEYKPNYVYFIKILIWKPLYSNLDNVFLRNNVTESNSIIVSKSKFTFFLNPKILVTVKCGVVRSWVTRISPRQLSPLSAVFAHFPRVFSFFLLLSRAFLTSSVRRWVSSVNIQPGRCSK